MRNRFHAYALAALVTIGLAWSPAAAQQFPTRPVVIVVPQAAGGGTNIISRIIGQQLSTQLGQPFVVENRTGAGTVVGTVSAAHAAADGYTLLAGLNANMAVNSSLYANLAYDPIRDFVPVGMMAEFPFVLVVNKDSPAQSVKELIALAKSKPGEINYASAGTAAANICRWSCSS